MIARLTHAIFSLTVNALIKASRKILKAPLLEENNRIQLQISRRDF